MIELEKFPDHIASLKNNDWHKLFDIVDEIYKSKDFGEPVGFKKNEAGMLAAPYWNPADIVLEFLKTANLINILPAFDWMEWKEGKEMLFNELQNYEPLDIITLCKLLTTIVRANRFSDGYLISCFEKEIIKKIIHSLKNKIESKYN